MDTFQGRPRNVEYILLAEFDITAGSTVKHQFPYPIGVDQQSVFFFFSTLVHVLFCFTSLRVDHRMLAEFMLPDGTHKRQRDWTVFFLNRPGQEGVLADSTHKRSQPSADLPEGTPGEVPARIFRIDPSSPEWKPVGTTMLTVRLSDPIRILNGTTEIHRIFRTPYLGYQVMNPLFIGIQDSENTFIGMRFRTKEEADVVVAHVARLIHLLAEDKELVAQGIPPRDAPRPFLYCLNCVTTKLDPSVHRGAVVKAMAVCSPHHFIHEFERLLLYHLDRYFEAPTEAVLRDLYFAINAADFGVPAPLDDPARLVLRHAAALAAQRTRTVPVRLGTGAIFNVHVPLASFPSEAVDFKVADLLARFGSQVMTIFNAVVLEKRVIFLGFNCPMEELCKTVLAAAATVAPPLRDVLHRVFPYTSLSYLDFEKLPSYILGVSNPVFEAHADWWDLLCDIQTGRVTVNPRTGADLARVCAAAAAPDAALYAELERCARARLGEDVLRARFQRYTQTIADAALGARTPPDAAAHAERVAAWQRTAAFRAHRAAEEARVAHSLFLNPKEVAARVAALQTRPALPAHEVQHAFELLVRNTTQPNQVDELLSLLPDDDGGLFPICAGLFHPAKAVRAAAAALCSRFNTCTFGPAIFNSYGIIVDFALRNALAETQQDDDQWASRISISRT